MERMTQHQGAPNRRSSDPIEPDSDPMNPEVMPKPIQAMVDGVSGIVEGTASEIHALLSPEEARRRELSSVMKQRGMGRER